VDKYEASVWEIPAANTALPAKLMEGRATLADLTAGGFQRGATSDNYGANCPDTGNGCKTFYAASVAGVTPSRSLTWFQAAAACRNAGKRLLTNAEWQAAALGTPDGAPCMVSASSPGATGTPGCVSDAEVFDMVGNVWEWVAEWQAPTTDCTTPLFAGTNDWNCMAGADASYGPAALFRGGDVSDDTDAGVFAIAGLFQPSYSSIFVGFRCAR
jgi:formylglycine-generating enzyme required for sulfatase activity